MKPHYLVQVRQVGEPWRTRDYFQTLDTAARHAAALASQTAKNRHWAHAFDDDAPLYDFVRVTLRGCTVYDPRAPKAPTVATC